MSDFERDIAARAEQLEQRYRDEHVAREAQMNAARLSREHEAAEYRRIMELGMRAVDLLISHDVEPRRVWDLEVIGRHMVPYTGRRGSGMREVDKKEWVEQGQGWEVYRSAHMHAGGTARSAIVLQDNGRLFQLGERGVPASNNSKSGNRRSGFTVGHYESASASERILNSESFANGLAHRIRAWGIYTHETRDPEI